MSLNIIVTKKARIRQTGFLLIEILVSLVIIAFGLLALASFVTKATTLSADTAQRARASALLADMAGRIRANKLNAAEYVTLLAAGSTLGSGINLNGPTAVITCSGATIQSLRDLCEWNRLLQVGNETGSVAAGAGLGYRGCIERVGLSTNNTYLITVAWGSMTPNAVDQVPASLCGAGVFDTTTGQDRYRRILQTTLRFPNLGTI